MASILDMMNSIEAAGDRGRMRGQETRLASLYSQAIGAPREQRTGLLSQIASVSPDAANSASGMFDKMDDNARAELGQYAVAFSALPDDQKAQAYPQLAQRAASLGLPVPQGPYQPQYAQGIAQLGQAFGGARGTATGVQSTYVDAQGNRVAILRDGSTQVLGRNAPSNQIIDTGNGFYGVNKGNLQAAPVMVGGQQRGEVPFTIDPNLPQEVQDAIRNDPNAGSPQGIQSLDMGQQLRSVPKPTEPPDTFVTMSPDEVAAAGLPAGTVAQRSLRTGKIEFAPQSVQPDAAKPPKPMPVSALRLVQDAREKLSIAEGNIQSLSRIGQQIEDGELDLGVLANAAAKARNFAGMSTPESRNFALMMSSLEKLRNDSLRLNNGVQTEGDAQRAWNELMANLNDERVVADQINRIIEINKRAATLHQANMDEVNANYGPGSPGSTQAPSVNNMSDAEILEALNR